MRRPLMPLWTATPSRFATLSRPAARLVLAALVLMLVLLTLPSRHFVGSDSSLFAGATEGVRHGGNYYAVVADLLRASGESLHPFTMFALPTLAVIQAALPTLAVTALLYALAAAVAAAWYPRLADALTTPVARWVAAALLLVALLPALSPDRLVVPDTWAGLFVALSLALRRPGQWIESVAFALAAILVREAAIVFALVMAIFAWRERRRDETIAWCMAIGVALIVIALHAHAVAAVIKPLDGAAAPVAPLGIGLVIDAVTSASLPAWVPHPLGAVVIGLALFGWANWRNPIAPRLLAFAGAVAILIGVFGRAESLYWGQMLAPLLLPGLIFAADGWRDLLGTALDTRRITVTRIIR